MPDKPNNPFQFWQELKRRKVIRVIPVYAAASFVLLELVDIIAEPFELPDSTLKFVFVLLCVGFIIAVILSWVYDITPEGVKKTRPISKVTEQQKEMPTKMIGWKIATYISVVIIVGLIIFHTVGERRQTKDILELEKSIAVLPFTSLSDDPDKQYLADGVMDEILLHLSKIEDLRVMSRTSVLQYRETDKTATEICQELDVAYLLEGSFQKYGDEARLIVQLIKSGKEAHEWSDKYDRNWNDIFSVQSEVAQTIARELQVVLTPEEKQLIKKVPTINMTAWDLHLQAKEFYDNYLVTSNTSLLDTITQIGYKSLELDPEFALAYYWLGLSSLSDRSISTYYKPFFTDSALFFFNKALELDSTLAEAYLGRGMYYFEKYQIQKAIHDLGKAIRIDPNYSTAYIAFGIIYEYSRDFVNALINLKKAEKLERADMYLASIYLRFYSVYICIGDLQKAELFYNKSILLAPDYTGYWVWALTIQGKYEDLLNTSEKLIARRPEFLAGYLWKSFALLDLGRTAEAEEYIRIAMDLGEIGMNNSHRVGIILWVNGKKDEAMEYFNRQIRYSIKSIRQKDIFGISHAAYDLAGVYAFLGKREEAIKWLREYEKLGFTFGVHEFIKVDPLFDSLRNDEEFKEIVKRANNEKAEIRARITQMEEQGML